jgi:hypothetical protein
MFLICLIYTRLRAIYIIYIYIYIYFFLYFGLQINFLEFEIGRFYERFLKDETKPRRVPRDSLEVSAAFVSTTFCRFLY